MMPKMLAAIEIERDRKRREHIQSEAFDIIVPSKLSRK